MSRKHVTRLRESPTDEKGRYLFPEEASYSKCAEAMIAAQGK